MQDWKWNKIKLFPWGREGNFIFASFSFLLFFFSFNLPWFQHQILSLEGSFPSLECWSLDTEQVLLMLCYWCSRCSNTELLQLVCTSLLHLYNDDPGFLKECFKLLFSVTSMLWGFSLSLVCLVAHATGVFQVTHTLKGVYLVSWSGEVLLYTFQNQA